MRQENGLFRSSRGLQNRPAVPGAIHGLAVAITWLLVMFGAPALVAAVDPVEAEAKALQTEAWQAVQAHADSDSPNPAVDWAHKLWRFGRNHLDHEKGLETAAQALFLYVKAGGTHQAAEKLMGLGDEDPLWPQAVGLLAHLVSERAISLEAAISRAEALYAGAESAKARWAAARALGSIWLVAEHTDRAREWYSKVLELAHDEPQRAEARGMIYEIENLQPGMPAPSFALDDFSGVAMTEAELEGRYSIVHFWASWCSSCAQSASKLVALRVRVPSEDLTLFGISVDEETAAAKRMASSWEMDWRHGMVDGGWSSPTARQFNLRSLPAFFLFSPDGKLIDKSSDLDSLVARLDVELEGR